MRTYLDNSVALYWIQGQGEYKQFVANHVQKINSHKEVAWRYVPTADNPVDLASPRGHVEEADLCWHGPRSPDSCERHWYHPTKRSTGHDLYVVYYSLQHQDQM